MKNGSNDWPTMPPLNRRVIGLVLFMAMAFVSPAPGQDKRPMPDPKDRPRISSRDTCHLILLGGLGDVVGWTLTSAIKIATVPWSILNDHSPSR